MTEIVSDIMNTLKPCPFCGKKHIDVAWSGEWRIGCNDCSIYAIEQGREDFDSCAYAIAKWNRRTP
jgi:hypothetical protein